MGTFKAYFKKEIIESIRQYRYIILIVGLIFFAISEPIMMKLLPGILKSQVNGDISSLFVITRKSVLQNYIKDLFQLGTIFIVFSMAGSLSDEIANQKFVFPYSKGCKPSGIVLSKVLHYSIAAALITFSGFCISFYYTNLLIKGESVSFNNVAVSAFLVILYFIFIINLAVFFSSMLKKGLAAGFITLGIVYFSSILNNIESLRDFIPYRLIYDASLYSGTIPVKTAVIIILYCTILYSLAIFRMNKIEVI